MPKSALDRFRLISLAEGISLLLLLGVAMPLKYVAGLPVATKIVGWPHGILFIVYLVALGFVSAEREWKWTRSLVMFVAASVPFGFLLVERLLRREAEQSTPAPEAAA